MSAPRRVAAIDCGTNSIRLLVADSLGDGRLVDVHREMRIVRLGEGVDRTGVLAPQAIERTREALADYAATIRELDARHVRMVATSATRDAGNREDFVAMVRTTLGTEPEVVTGDEEAALSFAGAVGTLPDVTGPVLLADVGGGSTELVAGAASGSGGLSARSIDIGSVRMTERHFRHDPPTSDEIEAVVADVRSAFALAGQSVPLRDSDVLVGVAGTNTTIAAIALGLTEYRPDAIHGARVPAAEIAEVTDLLVHATHDERAAIPALHPGRVDVIAAGALIVRTLVEVSGVTAMVASEHDILDGIALTQL